MKHVNCEFEYVAVDTHLCKVRDAPAARFYKMCKVLVTLGRYFCTRTSIYGSAYLDLRALGTLKSRRMSMTRDTNSSLVYYPQHNT